VQEKIILDSKGFSSMTTMYCFSFKNVTLFSTVEYPRLFVGGFFQPDDFCGHHAPVTIQSIFGMVLSSIMTGIVVMKFTQAAKIII
jgi:hypothetical protein